MADSVTIDDPMADNEADVDMDGADQALSTAPDNLPAEESKPEDAEHHVTYLDYLKSPITKLAIGTGDARTVLSAHQDLLTKSPFFEKRCSEVGPNGTIDMPDDSIEAVGSFLEYLYTGEYFPRRVGDRLEAHVSLPDVDSDGEQLLKHARIYTIAEKFSIPALKTLAQRKIRLTTSTARGEIAYARYVYATTAKDDVTIRDPVAKFWATRSYTLRHDAEDEFRAMCLEYPQFGFDVLSKVLDAQEKQRGGSLGISTSGDAGVGIGVSVDTPTTGRSRKRGRLSEAL